LIQIESAGLSALMDLARNRGGGGREEDSDKKSEVVETEHHVFDHRLLRPQHSLVGDLPDLKLIQAVIFILFNV
jgi:hypothetical protein